MNPRAVIPSHVPAKGFSLTPWLMLSTPFLQNQLSEHTRVAYQCDLLQFFEFLSRMANPPTPVTLEPRHLIDYRNSLTTFQPATVNRKLATVSAFLQFLVAQGLIRSNPGQAVKLFPLSSESKTEGFSDEEVIRILQTPDKTKVTGAMHSAVLHVLFFLGLRQGELRGLTIGSISSDRGVPTLKVKGKGHRERTLPIPQHVMAEIENYLMQAKKDCRVSSAPLFSPTMNRVTGKLDKHLTPNAVAYIVNHNAQLSGVAKKVSPHSCRATAISNALDNRATHRMVQAMAGWTSAAMITRYDKRRRAIGNSAVAKIDYAANTAKKM